MNILFSSISNFLSYKPSTPLLGTIFNLFGKGIYIHWGVVQVSLANAIVILAMFATFGLALILPFPSHKSSPKNKDQ